MVLDVSVIGLGHIGREIRLQNNSSEATLAKLWMQCACYAGPQLATWQNPRTRKLRCIATQNKMNTRARNIVYIHITIASSEHPYAVQACVQGPYLFS